jgi:hypothetical protein
MFQHEAEALVEHLKEPYKSQWRAWCWLDKEYKIYLFEWTGDNKLDAAYVIEGGLDFGWQSPDQWTAYINHKEGRMFQVNEDEKATVFHDIVKYMNDIINKVDALTERVDKIERGEITNAKED